MNKTQEDKLSMFLGVRAVCNNYATVVSAVPALKDSYEAFKAIIEEVQQAYTKQTTNTTGITGIKTDTRLVMTDLTMKAKGVLFSYANKTKDLPLIGRTKFTRTRLDKARDTQVASLCRAVYEDATTALRDLSSFGFTETQLVQLNDAIKAYEASLGTPEVAKGQKKNATRSLKDLLDSGQAILENEMDGMVENLEDAQTAFVTEYRTARMVILRGVVTTKPAAAANAPSSSGER